MGFLHRNCWCASYTGIGVLTGRVGVRYGSIGALGTVAALLTALVWELCGGDGVVSTGTELLSAVVGVRLGEAGSLSITVGYNLREFGLCVVGLVLVHVQPGCYLHQEVALFYLKIVFLVC